MAESVEGEGREQAPASAITTKKGTLIFFAISFSNAEKRNDFEGCAVG
jgi:hypothetical protein